MKLTRNERLAIIYASIFNFRLTKKQAHLWSINLPIKLLNSYTFKLRQTPLVPFKPNINQFIKIPTVQAVFLTGSLAINPSKKNADIDLMIITLPHTLWLTRAIIYIYLKINNQLRRPNNFLNKICPNIFLDLNHLKITYQNLYTAHEILQAQCLFDRSGVEKSWLTKNSWTKKYLPNAYKYKINQTNNPISNSSINTNISISKLGIGNWLLKYWLLVIGFIDYFAFFLQYLYMFPKITNEKISLGSAFFHPNDLSKNILAKFHHKVLKYSRASK